MSIQIIQRPLARPEPRLPSLHLVQTPRTLRRVSRLLMFTLLAMPLALVFVPWQQNVSGMGRVVAYTPVERQQTLDARIDGRVIRWWVVEGSQVKEGDPIVEIADNDPNVMIRLREQRDAAIAKLEAAQSKLDSADSVITQFEDAGNMAITAADQLVAAAEQKIRGAEQEVAAAKVAYETDTLQVRRVRQLAAEGLESRRGLEIAEQKYRESSAKLTKAEADLQSTKAELEYKKADRLKTRAEANAKIDSAKVYRQEAAGELALAQKDLSEIEVKLARQGNQKVVAPRNGTILRIVGGQDAEYVKAGDPLVVLVPESSTRAAEVWVDGNDAPLISKGRIVRLQ
ncbi:MAG: HlyD family secretion protein, partial [Isosphaeraceae bacterium]